MINFTAIDFETANASRASICQVGLVRVENGKIVGEINQLIRPDGGFDWRCVQVHGIDEFDVRDSPRFPDFWDEMRPFLDDAVVAHNAAFDISCLRSELELYGLEPKNFDYYCTLRLSRKFLPDLSSHKLDSVARFVGASDFKHHDALEDARACAEIFISLAQKFDIAAAAKRFIDKPQNTFAKSPSNLANDLPKSDGRNVSTCGRLKYKNPKEIRQMRQSSAQIEFPNMIFAPPTRPANRQNSRDIRRTEIRKKIARGDFDPQDNLNFDFSDIDFSKTFAVAGIFSSMSRGDVENLIAYKGGTVSKCIDGNTDYLIVGGVRPPSWDRGEYGAAIDRALEIETVSLVTEAHFLKFF